MSIFRSFFNTLLIGIVVSQNPIPVAYFNMSELQGNWFISIGPTYAQCWSWQANLLPDSNIELSRFDGNNSAGIFTFTYNQNGNVWTNIDDSDDIITVLLYDSIQYSWIMVEDDISAFLWTKSATPSPILLQTASTIFSSEGFTGFSILNNTNC